VSKCAAYEIMLVFSAAKTAERICSTLLVSIRHYMYDHQRLPASLPMSPLFILESLSKHAIFRWRHQKAQFASGAQSLTGLVMRHFSSDSSNIFIACLTAGLIRLSRRSFHRISDAYNVTPSLTLLLWNISIHSTCTKNSITFRVWCFF
jgi:hypothetical protein